MFPRLHVNCCTNALLLSLNATTATTSAPLSFSSCCLSIQRRIALSSMLCSPLVRAHSSPRLNLSHLFEGSMDVNDTARIVSVRRRNQCYCGLKCFLLNVEKVQIVQIVQIVQFTPDFELHNIFIFFSKLLQQVTFIDAGPHACDAFTGRKWHTKEPNAQLELSRRHGSTEIYRRPLCSDINLKP